MTGSDPRVMKEKIVQLNLDIWADLVQPTLGWLLIFSLVGSLVLNTHINTKIKQLTNNNINTNQLTTINIKIKQLSNININ